MGLLSIPQLNEQLTTSVPYIVEEEAYNSVPKPEEYTNPQTFTTATFTLKFSQDDFGKTAWIKAAAANPKGEIGSLGAAISTVIS